MADLAIKRNDLLPALEIICRDGIGPVDLDGATAQVRMVNVLNGSVKINALGTPASSVAFTVNPTTNVVTANGHGLADGRDVTLKSSGTLPAGLSTLTRYYVINATTNMLQLALVENGSAVDFTDNGSGTHSLLPGKVTYDWISGDTDVAGSYFAEVQTTVGGKQLSYPNDGQLLIEVVSDLV